MGGFRQSPLQSTPSSNASMLQRNPRIQGEPRPGTDHSMRLHESIRRKAKVQKRDAGSQRVAVLQDRREIGMHERVPRPLLQRERARTGR